MSSATHSSTTSQSCDTIASRYRSTMSAIRTSHHVLRGAYGGCREVLDLDPPARLRPLRRLGGQELSGPRRGTRLRRRLDDGTDRWARTADRTAGDARLRRGVHDPAAARRRGADHVAARPAAARVGRHRGRPPQPRTVGRRRRPWRQLPAVRGVRRGQGDVRQLLHRGHRADEGGVVRRAEQ